MKPKELIPCRIDLAGRRRNKPSRCKLRGIWFLLTKFHKKAEFNLAKYLSKYRHFCSRDFHMIHHRGYKLFEVLFCIFRI